MKNLFTFQNLGLSPSILEAITKKGFTEPSEIQRKIIPLLLEGSRDVMGIAQTGSGKTASFGLPILDRLAPHKAFPTALIVTPTRELALQVTEELRSLTPVQKRIRMSTLYGGASIHTQTKQLDEGADIVVGTPGRLCDLLKREVLHLTRLQYIVIDEADEMLKMGFIEDMETILSHAPDEKRVLLLSATMPSDIQRLSQQYMNNPELIKIQRTVATNAKITQQFIVVNRNQRNDALHHILATTPDFYGIIFCMTKREVDELKDQLKKWGYLADALHGDIPQSRREQVLERFRKHQITILVATDVAARGLDVQDLTHVINHSLPKDQDTYIHRVGRTGRAGKHGVALSLIARNQRFFLEKIARLMKAELTCKTMPTAEEVKEIQCQKLVEDVTHKLQDSPSLPYLRQAQAMLSRFDDDKLVAALVEKLLPKPTRQVYTEQRSRKKYRYSR